MNISSPMLCTNGKGPEYEGEVEESDIIMTLSEPCAVGNLFQVKAEGKMW